MVKIVLKEPVGGQLNPQGGSVRSTNYLQAGGKVTEELKEDFRIALKYDSVLSFVDPGGNPYLVPAQNIAFILEYPPNANKN